MVKKRRKQQLKPLKSYRPLTSIKEARRVTGLFHLYTAELEQNKTGKNLSKEKLENIEKKIHDIGGRERYQEASMLLTSQNKSSSKWVFQNLTAIGKRPKKGEPPLPTLEVGAINCQLLNCPWLDVYAIDIKSRNPKIHQVDFFDLDCSKPKYDVISNAMVVNCVPEPKLRGKMLVNCVKLLNLGGLLSIVLPLRCINWIYQQKFVEILELLGLKIVNINQSPKISFFACIKESDKISEKNKLIDRFYGNDKFALQFDTEMFI